jgi:hypothetical protein
MSNAFKAGRVIAPDAKWTGDEPDWNGWETWPTEKFYKTRARALGFYNYYLDTAAMKPLVLDWMKSNGYNKDDVSAIKEANPNVLPSTVGKLVRCLTRGMPSIHPQATDYFATLPFHDEPPVPKDDASVVHYELKRAITLLRANSSSDNNDGTKVKVPTPSPLDRIRERAHKEIVSPLEDCLEQWAVTRSGNASFNMSVALRDSKIPAQGCKTILDWLEKNHTEYNGALQREDEQLVEGYSYLSKPELRKIVKSLESMIDDVRNHTKIKNSTRKPRKKKVKDASKQVSKLKYQQHSADWSLDSVSPNRIPSSQRLYLFNTKTRALSVYVASGASGFEVKGTSLKGYDTSISFVATLRKPKETLNNILSSTPKQLEKLFSNLSVKKKPANGRINEQMVIVKVVENKL